MDIKIYSESAGMYTYEDSLQIEEVAVPLPIYRPGDSRTFFVRAPSVSGHGSSNWETCLSAGCRPMGGLGFYDSSSADGVQV